MLSMFVRLTCIIFIINLFSGGMISLPAQSEKTSPKKTISSPPKSEKKSTRNIKRKTIRKTSPRYKKFKKATTIHKPAKKPSAIIRSKPPKKQLSKQRSATPSLRNDNKQRAKNRQSYSEKNNRSRQYYIDRSRKRHKQNGERYRQQIADPLSGPYYGIEYLDNGSENEPIPSTQDKYRPNPGPPSRPMRGGGLDYHSKPEPVYVTPVIDSLTQFVFAKSRALHSWKSRHNISASEGQYLGYQVHISFYGEGIMFHKFKGKGALIKKQVIFPEWAMKKLNAMLEDAQFLYDPDLISEVRETCDPVEYITLGYKEYPEDRLLIARTPQKDSCYNYPPHAYFNLIKTMRQLIFDVFNGTADEFNFRKRYNSH